MKNDAQAKNGGFPFRILYTAISGKLNWKKDLAFVTIGGAIASKF